MILHSKEEHLVRLLQQGLLLVSDPWGAIARECGYTEDEVLDKIRGWREDGLIRRFGAFLDHYKHGLSANAMVAWTCPSDRLEKAGTSIAALPSVSHCYERTPHPGWPYNLYTMIHAETRDALMTIIDGIAEDHELTEYRVLHSKKEYKKTSSRLFMEDLP